MRFILTVLLVIGGSIFCVLGLNFLLQPLGAGASLSVTPDGVAGLSTIRADFTAFFILAGFCMVWGGWRRNGDLLLVPAALFGIAFLGRVVDLMIHGTYPLFWQPMLIEAVTTALCITGNRVLLHHKLKEIAD